MTELLYLTQADVAEATDAIDPVKPVEDALVLQAEGRTTLPMECYLSWRPPAGGTARSIAMAGHLDGRDDIAVGVKVINANVDNPAAGIPRASGLTLLFDPQTARPLCAMHAGRISALRTAAVSLVAMRALQAPGAQSAALIGAGNISARHLELMLAHLSDLREVIVYDMNRRAAEELIEGFSHDNPGISFKIASSAREAIADQPLIVTATTTTTSYIPFEWLAPGSVLIHVSLDDARPDVVDKADLLVVDDWELVRHDQRRLLGRMHREGLVHGPAEDSTAPAGSRAVDATIGEIVAGRHPGRQDKSEVVLVNPFGMAIMDVAYTHALFGYACREGLGTKLPFD